MTATTSNQDVLYFVEDGSDPRLPKRDADVLVEVGRDIAAAIIRHPEKYEAVVMQTKVFVVDDAAYDALFYLFSGKTRTALFRDEEQVGALFIGKQPVLSMKLMTEAQRREAGY